MEVICETVRCVLLLTSTRFRLATYVQVANTTGQQDNLPVTPPARDQFMSFTDLCERQNVCPTCIFNFPCSIHPSNCLQRFTQQLRSFEDRIQMQTKNRVRTKQQFQRVDWLHFFACRTKTTSLPNDGRIARLLSKDISTHRFENQMPARSCRSVSDQTLRNSNASSAPRSRTRFRFSSEEAVAITCNPSSFPICTAAVPTPPAAA